MLTVGSRCHWCYLIRIDAMILNQGSTLYVNNSVGPTLARIMVVCYNIQNQYLCCFFKSLSSGVLIHKLMRNFLPVAMVTTMLLRNTHITNKYAQMPSCQKCIFCDLIGNVRKKSIGLLRTLFSVIFMGNATRY